MMASVSTIKSKHDLFCPPKHIENIPDSSEATVSICSPLIIVILIFISYDFLPHVSICVNIASILGLLFICLCSYAVFGTIMYRLLVVELLLRFHHLFIDISFFIWRAAAQQWLCIYCYGIFAGHIEVTQLDPRYSFLFLWSFSFFSLESFNRWQLCRVVVSFFFLFAFRIVSLICRSSFVIFFLVSLRFSSEFEMYNHEKRNKAKKKSHKNLPKNLRTPRIINLMKYWQGEALCPLPLLFNRQLIVQMRRTWKKNILKTKRNRFCPQKKQTNISIASVLIHEPS